jgi:hypothetical protein
LSGILGIFGLVIRLPFFLIGVVVLLLWSMLAWIYVLVIWFVLLPVFWTISLPFRLFAVPVRGGAGKLQRGLEKDFAGWNSGRRRVLSSLGSAWNSLATWLLEGF